MSLRDIVTGSDVCTPSDGAGPSNAVGALVDTLLGGVGKTQEQLRELPNVAPGHAMGMPPPLLTPYAAANSAAMMGPSRLPGLPASTMDPMHMSMLMNKMAHPEMQPSFGEWDELFNQQQASRLPPPPPHQLLPGPMPPPFMPAPPEALTAAFRAFLHSCRSPGPLPPPPSVPLSVPEQCRIRDRATILGRHLFGADGGAELADQQVALLLRSLNINPAELPAELHHAHDADWHNLWAGGATGAGPQTAAWDHVWAAQMRAAPQRPLSTGWASEFASQPLMGPYPTAAPNAWAEELAHSQPPPSVADGWVNEFPAASTSAAAVSAAARPAGRDAMASSRALLEALSNDANPKMRSSKFFQFVSKMSRGEIVLEDNKVVERPVASSEWANELDKQVNGNALAEEFARNSHAFHGRGGDWASDFAAQEQQRVSGKGAEWASDFAALEREREGVNRQGASTTGAEWADAFANGVANLSLEDNLREMEDAWREVAKEDAEWERIYTAHAGLADPGTSHSGAYVFADNNPFIGDPEALSKARDLFRRGVLGEAVLACEAEVAAHPENAEAWRLLGKVHAENDDDPQAIAALMRALEIAPNDRDILLSLGVSHTNELDQTAALRHLTNWMRNHPTYAKFLESSGPPPDSSQQLSHAISIFSAAATSHPGDGELSLARGVLAHLARRMEDAVALFEEALTLMPRDYSLWNKLGATLANHGRSADAIRAYQKALDLKPNYMRAWVNMGISFSNLSEYERSASFYVRALQLNPSADHVWGYLRTVIACSGASGVGAALENRDLDALGAAFPLV